MINFPDYVNRITLFAQYFSGFYKPIKKLYFENSSVSVSSSFNSETMNNGINDNINRNNNENNEHNENNNNNDNNENNNNQWYNIGILMDLIIIISLYNWFKNIFSL